MAGVVCFTEDGTQYTITHVDENQSIINGGPYVHIDIEKPGLISKGSKLRVQCIDSPYNAELGIGSKHYIETPSVVTHIYQMREEPQIENEGFDRD